MAWKITKDLIEDGKATRRNMRSRSWDKLPKNKTLVEFRMFDGDDMLYYEGVATPDEEFQPLDDFGRSSGCVKIQYKDEGKWTTL